MGPGSSLLRRFRFILLSKEPSVVEEHGHVVTLPIGTFSFRPPEVQGSRNMPCDPADDGGKGPCGRNDNHGTAESREEDNGQGFRM